MKKYLLLFGIIGPVTAAHANIISFSPERFSLQASTGILNGEAREYVYDTDNHGRKMSQLNWKIENTPILNAALTWDAAERATLRVSGWTTLATRGADMDDYDWMDPNQKHYTDWSSHPATRLNYANQYDVRLTGWVLKAPDYRLGVMAGYEESRFSWTANGGRGIYNNGTEIVEFDRNERGIGYQQTYRSPYIGLEGLYRYQNIEVTALFKYSGWSRQQDNDEHYARNLRFREESHNADFYSASADIGYYVTPQAKVYVGYAWNQHKEKKTGARVYDYAKQTGDYNSDDAAGLDNKNDQWFTGVKYRF